MLPGMSLSPTHLCGPGELLLLVITRSFEGEDPFTFVSLAGPALGRMKLSSSVRTYTPWHRLPWSPTAREQTLNFWPVPRLKH